MLPELIISFRSAWPRGRHVTSVLGSHSAVVGAVAALLAEVDVGPDAALQQGLGGPGVVAHAQEDLVGLVLAEEAQGVHLRESGAHSLTWNWAFGTPPAPQELLQKRLLVFFFVSLIF